VAAAACGAVGPLYVAIFAVPPLIPTFVERLGISHAEAGLLMSAFTFAYAVASPVAGAIADRIGPPRAVVAGLLLCGLATLAFALAESFAALLVLRAVIGLSASLIYAPGIVLVLSVIPRERASAVGWFSSALYIGIATSYLATPLVRAAAG
jgi:MFS family permease